MSDSTFPSAECSAQCENHSSSYTQHVFYVFKMVALKLTNKKSADGMRPQILSTKLDILVKTLTILASGIAIFTQKGNVYLMLNFSSFYFETLHSRSLIFIHNLRTIWNSFYVSYFIHVLYRL